MKQLIEYLSQFVTDRRFNLLRKVASERTRYITIALEDIYQSHNASAVLRTCDCLGIQDVHIIEKKNRYSLNPDVELGSAQWLNLYKYNRGPNPAITAVDQLKSKGYRIVATTPHTDDVSLDDFDLSKGPVALLFGTEMRGLTDETLSAADEFLRIPMSGFTESFNISVSAAIALYTLNQNLRKSELNWQLPEHEIDTLVLDWLRKSIRDSDLLEKRYIFDNQNQGACPSSQ
ncbi:MAG: RNA methyltransferase [Bacteroidota bacterium]